MPFGARNISVDLFVHLKRSTMPRPTEWNLAMKQAGFDVELDLGFDQSHTGFLPCKFRGIPTGFEFYGCDLKNDDKQSRGIPEAYDFSVTFTTGSDLREFAASLIAAGVLCQSADGMLVDPQSGNAFRADSVMAMVKKEITSIENEL
jgi:hypothetical protein